MTQEPHGDMGNIEAEILWNVCQTLFGDNVDYVGNVLSTYPERRRANFVRICNAALRRLGDQVNEPGAVPPSVIGFLLNEGSYTTGVVSSEYAGGFVACSRTANPTDERALRRLLTVNRLGEYAVRSHYHFYSALRLLILHTRNAPAVDFERDRFNLATFIPAGYYILAMDYNRDEIARMPPDNLRRPVRPRAGVPPRRFEQRDGRLSPEPVRQERHRRRPRGGRRVRAVDTGDSVVPLGVRPPGSGSPVFPRSGYGLPHRRGADGHRRGRAVVPGKTGPVKRIGAASPRPIGRIRR